MVIVGAATGDDVDDRAAHLAKLGAIGVGGDVHLGDVFGCRLVEREAERHVHVVDAVDQHVVVLSAAA